MHKRSEAKHANRCFVVDREGAPLGPCGVQRARKLRKSGRARLYKPEPYTIQLKDVRAADLNTSGLKTEVRVDPGRKHTGIAVVMLLEVEDRVVYQEELQHRTDISNRLGQRGNHRRRWRHEKWHRTPRFDNRKRNANQLPPSIESVVSNQQTRVERLAEAAGTKRITIETARFDTAKILNPGVRGIGYQQVRSTRPSYGRTLPHATSTSASTAVSATGKERPGSSSTTSCRGRRAGPTTRVTWLGHADPATSGRGARASPRS